MLELHKRRCDKERGVGVRVRVCVCTVVSAQAKVTQHSRLDEMTCYIITHLAPCKPRLAAWLAYRCATLESSLPRGGQSERETLRREQSRVAERRAEQTCGLQNRTEEAGGGEEGTAGGDEQQGQSPIRSLIN